jgi:hypothetical protein
MKKHRDQLSPVIRTTLTVTRDQKCRKAAMDREEHETYEQIFERGLKNREEEMGI